MFGCMMRPTTCKDFYCLFLLLWLLPGFIAISLPNVAPSGTASQVSTMGSAIASKAIDGDKNPSFSAGSCSHTNYEPLMWWSLLLPAVYRITAVSITNRNELPERINNAEILIGNSPENNGNNNPRCTVIPDIPSGGTSTFDCGGMIGRLVNVCIKTTDSSVVLTLCEVEVYGEVAAFLPSFSAVVMGRGISVVERKLCWSDALLYCRDFYWDLLSIHSEEEQKEVEEVLRTAPQPLTKHVWLGLRRYLKDGKWFWMSGASMNYTHLETNSVWQMTSPCGGADTSGHFRWTDLPCQDHLHFICSTDMQKDKKRVEFFSSIRPPTLRLP